MWGSKNEWDEGEGVCELRMEQSEASLISEGLREGPVLAQTEDETRLRNVGKERDFTKFG